MMTPLKKLRLKLTSNTPVLIDGATATELERRGFAMEAPLWSAQALLTDVGCLALQEIHQDYIEAGADIITANTFRTTRLAVSQSGTTALAPELTQRAVDLVRGAAVKAHAPHVVIAGSLAPVADAYRPDLTPAQDILREEHYDSLINLRTAQVDVVLAETMNNWREVHVIGDLCKELNMPLIVSFVCDADGQLLSGENYEPLSAFVKAFKPLAICVNCTSLEATVRALSHWSAITSVPLGAYPNVENRHLVSSCVHGSQRKPSIATHQFVEFMMEASARYGISLFGGCCGTTPTYISAMKARIDSGAL